MSVDSVLPARRLPNVMFQAMSLRERQVMTLVTSGLLNKQVAGQLGLSEITVKIHRGSAMRKMGARTLPDLVRMAEIVRGTRMMADERLEV
jgi:FixJ family two-component response regulator